MPMLPSDNAFIHIEVISDFEVNYIVLVRTETEPSYFAPRIIYRTRRTNINAEWQVVSIEYL